MTKILEDLLILDRIGKEIVGDGIVPNESKDGAVLSQALKIVTL